jgi:catechol 2,3-dioxygenase-like lactoylglutathione lyase family enzyme
MTRRQIIGVLSGAFAARALRAESVLTVAGVDHLKFRVASAGASALFYSSLFGGEIVALRNSTFQDSPQTDEIFLHIGEQPGPYLMFATVRSGEQPGLDHISLLAGPLSAARPNLERAGIPLIKPDQWGIWFRDPDNNLIELIYGPTRATFRAVGSQVPLPSHLRDLRPAFDPAAITRIELRTMNLSRATEFYSRVIAPPSGTQSFALGSTTLDLRIGMPGLERFAIAIRGFTPDSARRILDSRGIPHYGAPQSVLFRDPDGNELQLVAP